MRRCYPKISQGLPDPAWQSQADLPERANLNNPTAPHEQRPQLLIWLSSWSGTQHRHSKMQSLAALHLCLAQKPHPVDAFLSPSRKLRIEKCNVPKNETGSFLFPQRQMCTRTGLMHGVQTSMNTSIGTTSNEDMSKANSPRCVKERLKPYILRI